MSKISWQGWLMGIQPRIRLTRSFDQRSHTYLGYCLFIHGNIGSETGDFSIGIGSPVIFSVSMAVLMEYTASQKFIVLLGSPPGDGTGCLDRLPSTQRLR
jgi:hypothetical protein